MDGDAPLGASRHKFTVDDVLRMIEARVIPEKARVVLRDGELIDTPAEGPLHSNVKSELIMRVSVAVFGRYRIGADTPLRLAEHEWPEPDLFVTPQAIKPADARGSDTLLVVEIANSSLGDDLGEMAALYALHGVREYWVVDLINTAIHVHLLGDDGCYGAPHIAATQDIVRATLAQGVEIRLADLL